MTHCSVSMKTSVVTFGLARLTRSGVLWADGNAVPANSGLFTRRWRAAVYGAYCFCEDRNGKLWIGFYDGTLAL